MKTLLTAIEETDDSVVPSLFVCGCQAATRVLRTEHGPEIRFELGLILVLCSWHEEIQRVFARLVGASLSFPVWVPEGAPFVCPREGCREPIVGLRRELALPHRYFPHEHYVPVCAAHQGYPSEWVPLDLSRFEESDLPP